MSYDWGSAIGVAFIGVIAWRAFAPSVRTSLDKVKAWIYMHTRRG